MGQTTISWTDITDNIIVAKDGGWWCRKISPGCTNCYAEKLNDSTYFKGNHLRYAGKAPPLKLREDVIDGWKRMRTPKRHFVASMTDVFGDWVPWDWAVRFLRGMWCAPTQTFQVLTKRPEIACDYITRWLKHDGLTELPANIWIGASIENQKCADFRIPPLLKIPARVRFLSAEPLLSAIDLAKPVIAAFDAMDEADGRRRERSGINWVIVGGESGPKARPCNVDWLRSIVEQCKGAGVACFVKQMGAKPSMFCGQCGKDIGASFRGGFVDACGPTHAALIAEVMAIHDKKGGDINEWPDDLKVRQFPA